MPEKQETLSPEAIRAMAQREREQREKACRAAVSAALQQLGEQFDCLIRPVPVLMADGRIGASLEVKAV